MVNVGDVLMPRWVYLRETNSSHLKIDGWKTILSFWGKRPICRGEPVSFRQGSAKWGKTNPQSRCGVEVGYVDFLIPSVIRTYPAGAIWWVYWGEITCLQLGGRDLPVVEIRHVLWMARIQAWTSSWTAFLFLMGVFLLVAIVAYV